MVNIVFPIAFVVGFCVERKKGGRKSLLFRWLSVFALHCQLCKLLAWLLDTSLQNNSGLCIFASPLVVVVRLKPNQHISDFAILRSTRSRCRPLWQPVNDIRLEQKWRGLLHHPNIVGVPKHFCHSVGHHWANSRARSMLSMLCLMGSWYIKFVPFLVQCQTKIEFRCWQQVNWIYGRWISPRLLLSVCLLSCFGSP